MRVLVVEDEVSMAETIRDGLTPEGFTVDLTHAGDEGLWTATETPFGAYDAIVLDIMLPRLSGYEVCRRLREREVWTPILMLTAKDGEYDQADALDLGADDYLIKPFSFVVLIARLRALIRRGAPERPSVLRAGDLTLDPAERRVLRADTPISVTPREFALLEFLMRHRGQAMTKTAIIENVWDAHFDGDPNIVEVYIGYLRKKIDHPFGRATIETVRGAGYRIAADGGSPSEELFSKP
ncbi:response regulator transcription factor [Actinoplanes sp. NPDC051851]|uniref:response regulator transcription factor n=1 Tax=Actinoplanes sp. NPDC051851 TaxID=3154753 RepID=UPI003414695C